ncbi:MAG: ferredoxin family protein [Desulfobacterales bacterium]|nr:MAG: ferredoxin family protein [Desulfobacterales bacterium]
MPKIEVNMELCNGCAACCDACPMEVLAIDNDRAKPMHPDMCMNCQLCEIECPHSAIKVCD